MKFYAPLNDKLHPGQLDFEIHTHFQLPSFHVIGLLSKEVSEAKDRVWSAIESSKFEFPKRKVVVNLSPAHIHKKGTGFDLGIACSIIQVKEEFSCQPSAVLWGELGLDGQLKSTAQVKRAIFLAVLKKIPMVIIPKPDLQKAQDFLECLSRTNKDGLPSVFGAKSLVDAVKILRGRPKPPLRAKGTPVEAPKKRLLSLAESLKKVSVLSLAGHHHLLFLGARGTGKSHALSWIVSAMPPVDPQTMVERSLLAELSHQDKSPSLIRKVSTNIRPAALSGRANQFGATTGELSLAHGGLLLADEFLEWHRDSRELLREPLESQTISISQSHGNFTLPADFLFVGTGNFCPCGGWPHFIPISSHSSRFSVKRCICTENTRSMYLKRLSGPILDRIDIISVVRSFPDQPQYRSFKGDIYEKIHQTRQKLFSNWGKLPGKMSGLEVEEILENHSQINQAFEGVPVSSLRSRHKIIRLALTLAALEDQTLPERHHFMEARLYRSDHYFDKWVQ